MWDVYCNSDNIYVASNLRKGKAKIEADKHRKLTGHRVELIKSKNRNDVAMTMYVNGNIKIYAEYEADFQEVIDLEVFELHRYQNGNIHLMLK